jgi:hypothetical protein
MLVQLAVRYPKTSNVSSPSRTARIEQGSHRSGGIGRGGMFWQLFVLDRLGSKADAANAELKRIRQDAVEYISSIQSTEKRSTRTTTIESNR